MTGFIEAVARATGVSQVTVAFIIGGVVISLLAASVGRIARQMGVWRGKADAPDRTQSAFTTKTPRQVVQEGQEAQRKLACCQLLLVLGSLVFLTVYALWRLERLDEVFTWASRNLEGLLTP